MKYSFNFFKQVFVSTILFKKSCSLRARISKIDLIRMLILHIWRNFIVLVNLLDWLLVSRYSCKNIYAILRRQYLSFFNIASDIFFLRHRVSFCNSEQSGIVKKYFPRGTYKFARSNFELTMAIMAAISKKKWTFAMRTGKRLIKNRFYAAFYYNRLFRRNVERATIHTTQD